MFRENPKYVETSYKTHPSFIRDVLPTLQPWFMLIAVHGVYFYSGNIMIVLWAIFILTPIYDRYLLDDSTNIGEKYENNFKDYAKFKLPLYAYLITVFCMWIYYLLLFSTNY